MIIRNINTIGKGFSKKMLFDFYAIQSVADDNKFSILPNREEVERHYEAISEYLYDEIFRQLAGVVMMHFISCRLDRGEQARAMLNYFDLVIPTGVSDDEFRISKDGYLSSMRKATHRTLNAACSYCASLPDFRPSNGTWRNLAIELANLTANNTRQYALGIDKMLGMTHHSGQIAEYMQQYRWLPDALDFRSQASFSSLLCYASSNVYDMLKSAAHGL